MKKYICRKCGYKLKLFVVPSKTPRHCDQAMELKEPFKPGLDEATALTVKDNRS